MAKIIKQIKPIKKNKFETVAVIDIGSNELRLRIAENAKGKLKYLESLSFPLSLGRDTFDTGKISFEKVDKACDIIKNYLQVASELGVSKVRAVTTTAVREALNRDYILDQIKLKTSLNIQVYDNTEEKLYIYKMMSRLLGEETKESAMMVYLGAGNIGISILNSGKIHFAQNISIGSLRVSEIFFRVQEYSTEFFVVLEEYIAGFMDVIKEDFPDEIPKNFIASGHEISMLAKLCQAKKDHNFLYISKKNLNALYEEIKYKSVDRLASDYELTEEKAEVLLPAICIYKHLLEFTKSESIVTPLVFLSDALIYEMLFPDVFAKIHKEFYKSTILSAEKLAKKYGAMEAHYALVEKYALKIFDKMKKIHGMGGREKLLLQTAAILHDIGKFVSVRNHYRHSYNILTGTDIVGLNLLDINIVANLCLYHSRITPDLNDPGYKNLNRRNRVLVSKLTAILRIADSLDRSREQKFTDIDVQVTEDELTITITTNKNIELEQWSFNTKSAFFQEVFGLKAILKKKVPQ